MKFGIPKPTPQPDVEVLEPSADSKQEIEREVRRAEAEVHAVSQLIDSTHTVEYSEADLPTDVDMSDDNVRLDRLVAHDFPFDESQRKAIQGIPREQFACLTGAAGTGKTTVTKAIVDEVIESGSVGEVNMATYFKSDESADGPEYEYEDDYEKPTTPEAWVPSICLCAFTGQASQMIKKNFPTSWHPVIFTIHRMLAYMPEYYDDWSDEKNEFVKKMRFIPTYTAENKMPWDVIFIDEAGMQSVDLWANVIAACKPTTRIYMIGDINQLPPVHGQSIFGYALQNWPAWELTEVHRQVGVNNSIVDNAWRILQGKTPISDSGEVKLSLTSGENIVKTLNWMVQYQKDWKFVTIQVPDDQIKASKYIRLMMEKLQGRLYDPIRDTIITAVNGYDGSNGRFLGQIPMNLELALSLNHEGQRYFIDAGRERKSFGIGEKVMNTRNDHQAGITNGMTGIVLEINRNENYQGEYHRYGRVEEVAEYMQADEVEDDGDFDLEDLAKTLSDRVAADAGKKEKEKKERGPASHSVTVQFGHGEHARVMTFRTLAEVASLMTAYVVTCHKMQGAECPHIFTICHAVHKQMLFREWLYTAVTRASQKCVVLFTPYGMAQALNKQRIKGTTLAEKARCFQELQRSESGDLVGYKVELPAPKTLDTSGDYQRQLSLVEQKRGLGERRIISSEEFAERMKPQPKVQPVIVLNQTNINIDKAVIVVQRDPERSEGISETELKPVTPLKKIIDLKPQPRVPNNLTRGLNILMNQRTRKPFDDYEVTRPALPADKLQEAVDSHRAIIARDSFRHQQPEPKSVEPAQPAQPKKFVFGVKKS